jgi:tetratricopeptide (TPR) repeat protein
MSYPGNPTLTEDVRERISTTFRQTVDLVVEGKDQEALVGCEFILRMDPAYAPAKTLIQRLQSQERPVAVDDLRDGGGPSPAPGTESLGDLDDLDALGSLEDLEDLGDLDDLGFEDGPATPAPAAAPPAAAPPAASGLAAVIHDLLRKRNFQQVLQVAERRRDAVARDPRLQELVETAQSRLESDAFVQSFVDAARQARADGKLDEMEAHLSKARALDPEHPQVLSFDAAAPGPGAAADDLPASAAADAGSGDEDLFADVPEDAAPAAAAPAVPDDDLLALQAQSLALEAPTGEADDEEISFADAMPGAEDPEAAAEPDVMDEVDDLTSELSFADLEDDAGFEPAEIEPPQAFDDAGLGPAEIEPPAAADAAAGAPDFGPPDREGGDRIAELLAEGHEIYQRGEYQAAIDVWSRIFLIDIDNQEASNRIEEARSKKAELERQAEEVFHGAVGHIEKSSLEEAKESLRQVLELDPSHSMAREYLEQLEAGQVPAVRRAAEVEAAAEFETLGEVEDVEEVESAPSLEAAVERDRVVVVKKTDKRLIAAGALVALVVIAGGGFLVSNWDDFFPNREEAPQVVRVDPIERANKMHEAGNTENAIILLERIQPQDPIYEKAQALIAQWKALVEAPPEPVATGPSEAEIERLNLLLGAARNAHGQRQFIRARKYFDRASKILPLDANDLKLRHECDQALEPLEAQIELFTQGEYAQVIPELWRRRESEPSPDVDLLLTDAYYNLALTDLQRGDALGAAEKLEEALEIRPDNRELERMRLFAQTYIDRPQDLLYRIYVKYLPSRG